MQFEDDLNVYVDRDEHDVVLSLDHLQQPYTPGGTEALDQDAVSVSRQYLVDAAAIYGIPESYLKEPQAKLSAHPGLTDDLPALQLGEDPKPRHKSTVVVSYQQTVLGLPIWETGFSVTLDEDLHAVSSVSTVKPDIPAIEEIRPSSNAEFLKDIDDSRLIEVLGLGPTEQQIHINTQRLLVYLYDPEVRQEREEKTSESGLKVTDSGPTLDLPPVKDSIQTKHYYVVREVLFTWPLPEFGNVNWRTFIEVDTGSVLYLRAFMAAAHGYVYTMDPFTRIGASGPATSAPIVQLDAVREWKELPGITPSSPQALVGQYVRIVDFDPPALPPPTSITGDFSFSAPTDGFAGVNAYYQMASLFQLVKLLGFNMEQLFDSPAPESQFPLRVDHRGFSNAVNARAPGNTTGDGSGGFIFGHAAAGTTIGMGADFRVAAHEFSHALLWDAVHSPNFGFAHSAGDALGCIYCDPSSKATDRFDTFPWSIIRRRHDRDVAAGWAWGGSQDDRRYNSEQILSTTLFRAYRAIGGDDPDIRKKKWASRYMLYIIIAGIASLATSPITPTLTPNPYVIAMMLADRGTILGHPGGGIRKVIRWSFEKQGLYQRSGAPLPVTSRGLPPPVDVYIDDGRHGEYDYVADFGNATDVWNRWSADSGPTHQNPLAGATNYCYVRVKNRGTQPAGNIVVRVYHSNDFEDPTWPAGFESMTTERMDAPIIPPAGSTVVGPFEWIPLNNSPKDHMLASVSALGDPSNIDPASTLACAIGPTDIDKLVPFDNNIAMRTVDLRPRP